MNKDDSNPEQKIKEEKQEPKNLGPKGKSCKGFLYYSSHLKSKSRNPRCVGIPRALPQVPNYIVAHAEVRATKEGKTLANFYFGCLGYSVFMTEHDSAKIKQCSKNGMPVCAGLKVVVNGKEEASNDTSSAPAHVHTKQDGRALPPPRTYKPPDLTGHEFLNRFTRNANLVVSGVARSARKVGSYVKESIDDVLSPYRGRPK